MAESAATGAGVRAANRGEIALARLDIEYLRRKYAKATDLFGVDTPEAIAEGRALYHEIFTPDARIRTSTDGEVRLEAKGPDGWAKVANEALANYVSTQHLVGSQVVDVTTLEVDADGEVVSGEADMTSYLQAWHAREDSVWVFMGTYVDKVRFVPGVGWQIYDMDLLFVSGDDRDLGPPRG
jgi:hypothetical protein